MQNSEWQETATKWRFVQELKNFGNGRSSKSVRIAGLLANCYDRLLYSAGIYNREWTRRYKKKKKKPSWQDVVASGKMREAQQNKLTHYWPTYGTSRSHFCGVLPGSPGKRKLPATHSACPLIPSAANTRTNAHIVMRTTKPWGVQPFCYEDKRF